MRLRAYFYRTQMRSRWQNARCGTRFLHPWFAATSFWSRAIARHIDSSCDFQIQDGSKFGNGVSMPQSGKKSINFKFKFQQRQYIIIFFHFLGLPIAHHKPRRSPTKLIWKVFTGNATWIIDWKLLIELDWIELKVKIHMYTNYVEK